MCLLTDVIDWFVVNGIDYEPESIYTDVRVSYSLFICILFNIGYNYFVKTEL